MINKEEIIAGMEMMGNAELMRKYDSLNNFLLKGKQDLAKGNKMVWGMKPEEKNDLGRIVHMMKEREEVIKMYKKEIIKRMEGE